MLSFASANRLRRARYSTSLGTSLFKVSLCRSSIWPISRHPATQRNRIAWFMAFAYQGGTPVFKEMGICVGELLYAARACLYEVPTVSTMSAMITKSVKRQSTLAGQLSTLLLAQELLGGDVACLWHGLIDGGAAFKEDRSGPRGAGVG